MVLPRANITDFGKKQAKDTATLNVRAASKAGAILTARIEAAQTIPIREQQVIVAKSLGNDRIFDKWEVQIRDKEEMANFGQ